MDSGNLNQYLRILLRLLLQNLRRYNFLQHLICEILEVGAHRDKEELGGSELESEVAYSRAIITLRTHLQKELGTDQVISKCFHAVYEDFGGERLNAALAIALFDRICMEPKKDSLLSARDSWKPVMQENPSSFERTAMAHLLLSVSVL